MGADDLAVTEALTPFAAMANNTVYVTSEPPFLKNICAWTDLICSHSRQQHFRITADCYLHYLSFRTAGSGSF
jgi:hypothetical protein